LDRHYRYLYTDRFQEGEMRKRIQFMYGGKLEYRRFKYTGMSPESVLDRLPTAKIIDHQPDGWIIEAETFGDEIDMWLKSREKWIAFQN
jgi:hypothetical protein